MKEADHKAYMRIVDRQIAAGNILGAMLTLKHVREEREREERLIDEATVREFLQTKPESLQRKPANKR